MNDLRAIGLMLMSIMLMLLACSIGLSCIAYELKRIADQFDIPKGKQ